VLQRPIELGADLVTHSTTKYLNGHSDSIGGIVIATPPDDIEWLKFIQNAGGAILSPFDSWLVLRGTKTLACAWRSTTPTAWRWRSSSRPPEGGQRHLPGTEEPSPARTGEDADARVWRDAVVRRRDVRGGADGLQPDQADVARRKPRRRRDAGLPSRLDDHASVPPERRQAIGLTDSMVRISAGIEDPADSSAILKQALA
jgi:hypothetical protein